MYMWNQKKPTKKQKTHRYREQTVVARGWGLGRKEMGEGNQKVQNFSYKINNSWGCNIQHRHYS